MQTPSDTKERNYLKLGTRLALTFSGLAILAVIVTAVVLFINFRNQIRQDIRQRLLNVISITALQQDGDLHATLVQPEDKETDAYKTLSARNIDILKTDPELVFFFTLRQDEAGNLYFVLDNSADPTYESLNIGDIYDTPTDLLRTSFATLDRPIVEENIYTDAFGTFLSAYAPFYRSDGTREGVIGVDINAQTVAEKEREFLFITILLVLGTIPFVALLGWFIGNRLAAPLSRLATTAQALASGNFSLRATVNPNSQEVYELQNDFNQMTSRLQDLVSNLELRVAERTRELEARSGELEAAKVLVESRVEQLRAIATISRSIANIQNLDALLPEISRLISDAFGYYHAGIFLNDDNDHFAVLRAANSIGGQRMLARQHKLEIGRTGLVGTVAQSGRARIALDTGADAVFFENPDLPETRSEIALPLRVANKVIGVLDVQSDKPNAFAQEDIETLSILADQIAIAIQNARSFEETREALKESEEIYRRYIRQEWRSMLETVENPGFQFDSTGIKPLRETQKAVKGGRKTDNQTAIPITVRGEVVGMLNVRGENDQPLDQDELDIVEATAERVALAIENARLILDSQRRAAKERTIGEISGRITTLTDIDAIIQTAVKELASTIPDANIAIQFRPESEEM